MGLDRPLYVQYVTYIGQLLQGDLGNSVRSRAPVANLIEARLPASLSLASGGHGLYRYHGLSPWGAGGH